MEKIMGIILAAGKGTRMGSAEGSHIPKVMYEANGQPLIEYAVDNLKGAGVENIVLVVGYKKEMVQEYLDGEVEYAIQEKQLGTGHAVAMAQEVADGVAEATLVCYGDMPLFKVKTIKNLITTFEREKPAVAMLSVDFEDPIFWAFGRVCRNGAGEVEGIVEQKDCDEEQLKIKESNCGFYVFDSKWLWENINKIQTNNTQHEFYLTDLIGLAREQGKKVVAVKVSEEHETLGVNTMEQLKQAEKILAQGSKTLTGM